MEWTQLKQKHIQGSAAGMGKKRFILAGAKKAKIIADKLGRDSPGKVLKKNS